MRRRGDMFDCAIFDLDGTLVDSERVIMRASMRRGSSASRSSPRRTRR